MDLNLIEDRLFIPWAEKVKLMIASFFIVVLAAGTKKKSNNEGFFSSQRDVFVLSCDCEGR